MDDKPRFLLRTTVAVFAVLVFMAALVELSLLASTAAVSTVTFDADEANHALDGWQVYHALLHAQPPALYRAVFDQSHYPPLHSLLIAASYLVASPSLAASRMPTVLNFALTLVLLGWLTLRIAARDSRNRAATPWLPLAAAMFAVGLAITSKVMAVNAVLAMLEMTGALLGLLLLLAADSLSHAVCYPRRLVWLAATGLLITLLLFTKYAFGLFYLPGFIAALVTAVRPWRAGRRAWGEAAAIGACAVVVFACWWLATDQATLLLGFFDHDANAPLFSPENLLYLPALWFDQYTTTPVLALIVLCLAGLATVRHWRELAVRIAFWSSVVAFGVLTFSAVHEPRHFMALAPALWMLAGVGLVDALQLGADSTRWTTVALVGLLLLQVAGALPYASTLSNELARSFEGDPISGEVQDYALHHSDLTRPVLFMGDFNDQFGLLAMRWRAATLADQDLQELSIDYFPYAIFERTLHRTHRKPQIATSNPAFPRSNYQEILSQGYYATVVEIKQRSNYTGPRAGNPDDPLCGYPARETWLGDWVVTIYAVAAPAGNCRG